VVSALTRARLQSLAVAAALLPGAILAALFAVEAYRLIGSLGFPLDDSWIHAQFARNVATGHGFTFTGGQWVSGSTAPAWTIGLAAGYLILRNIVAAAYVLGLICQLAAGYYGFRIAELFGSPRPVAALAGTVVGVTPVITWGAVSDMEVPLAATLVLAGLYHHFRLRAERGWRRHAGMALLGASALARPESLAVVVVVLVSTLFNREALAARAARITLGALVAAIAFLPVVIFSYLTSGRPLPTTFYAKSGPGIVRAIETGDAAMAQTNLLTFGPRAVHNFWLTLVDQFGWGAWLLLPAFLAGVVAAPSRTFSLTVLAIYLVVPFAMGITAPQRLKPENVRYTAQLVALAPPLIAAAMSHLLRGMAPASLLVVGLLAVLTGLRTVDRAPEYARSVKNIQDLHVRAGLWIGGHLPEDAVVAANDVGAIAYFSQRRILDLEGLVSPEVLAYRRFADRGIRVVRDMRPDYIVIFPTWYPEISQSAEFSEIHRITIGDNVISAGDTLVIYQTPWARRQH
jgi:arabinofuranosyltransferase